MKRKMIQWFTLVLTNANINGFIQGKIYKGTSKNLCVPGLNCYSCPGAVGSCPIGSLQAVLGSAKYHFSFYVVGLLAAFGLVFGRFICGFLCPFGLLQELVAKVPFPQIKKPWNWLKYIKYAVLLVFVILMPVFVINYMGVGDPAFCKYICPAGTLTAGFPLLMLNPSLRASLGWLFALKVLILILVIIGCLLIYRFFCRFLCPLGAIYALFNHISFYKLYLDSEKCVACGACASACKMGVNPAKTPNSPECVRCGDCVRVCKAGALKTGFRQEKISCHGNCVKCKQH